MFPISHPIFTLKKKRMQTIKFKNLTSLLSIAKNFGIQIKYLEKLVNTDNNSDSFIKIEIPKKNPKKNGYRIVYQPKWYISDLHKNILNEINNFLSRPDKNKFIHYSAHGFISCRTTSTNAGVHIGKTHLLQIDIKNFFESIPIEKIVEVFKKLECTNKISEILTKICSVNNVLKEGLNTSPMLANLYFYDIDIKLEKLASKFQCTYTRYADDMTFSSNKNIKETTLLDEIKNILYLESLELSDKKTRYSSYGQSQYVTGLSISNKIQPRIPRKIKKLLRLELHYLSKFGFSSHFEKRDENAISGHLRLKGWLDYVLSVEPSLGKEMMKIYDKVDK